jgi:hypothetical protein
MIRTFIQVGSLVLTLEAAFFLAKSGLALSPGAIAGLASVGYGYSLHLIDNFAAQRADTFVGVALLLLGFILQLINTLWPFRWEDFAVHRGAAIYAFILAVVIGIGAHYFAREWAASTATAAKRLIDAHGQGVADNAVKPTSRP